MILETALAIGGALVTAAVGIPLATRFGDPQGWRRPAPLDQELTERRPLGQIGGFEPLDLGPAPMSWPSEVQRPYQGRAEPVWPSQTWDDEYFGAHWRGSAAPVLTPAPDTPSSRPRARRAEPRPAPSPPPSSMQQEQARAAQAKAALEAQARAARARVEQAAREKAEALRASAERVAWEQAQSAVTRTTEAVGLPHSSAPSPAELERLVATVGLAGTVQEIMRRTGWEFREAAHHLAKSRQR